MKKAVILLASGFEEIEALTIVDVLIRAGVRCDMCSIEGITVSGAHNIMVKADIQLSGTCFDEYDILVLPGGMPGSTNLRDNEEVIKVVRKMNSDNKIIAAICAAPIVLEKAGIIDGKRITSHPLVKAQLSGCIYVEEITTQDDNIITSRGPATALYFAFDILKKVGYAAKADELRKAMMLSFVEEIKKI